MATVWYKMRKDKLMSEDNIHYVGYGIDAYSGLRRVKSIKDITPNKEQLARQIKIWNRCRISLVHLEDVIEDFLDTEYIEERPFSSV